MSGFKADWGDRMLTMTHMMTKSRFQNYTRSYSELYSEILSVFSAGGGYPEWHAVLCLLPVLANHLDGAVGSVLLKTADL